MTGPAWAAASWLLLSAGAQERVPAVPADPRAQASYFDGGSAKGAVLGNLEPEGGQPASVQGVPVSDAARLPMSRDQILRDLGIVAVLVLPSEAERGLGRETVLGLRPLAA